ncbi:MAG: response regulator, partial [Lachnospiraceae bacterium]
FFDILLQEAGRGEKMYKVLLVDDEFLIREAISENIHWEELGYELSNVCENGKEAIAEIENNPPDLILSDICMPYVDGIELAKYVYEHCPEIKIVIISGYDNFDYAKSAIAYQVMEYILKPVTASELSDVLLRMKNRLDEEKEKGQFDKIKEAYEKSMPLLKERFLNQFVKGKGEVPDAKERLESYGISLQGECFCALQIQCQSGFNFEHHGQRMTDELALFAVYNITEESLELEENCEVFQDTGNVTTVLMAGESEYQLEDRIKNIFHKIQQLVCTLLQINTVVLAGRCVSRIEEIPQSYQNAVAVKEFEFLFGENVLLFGKEFSHRTVEDDIDITRWQERFVMAVKQNNERDLKLYTANFFEKIRSTFTSKNKTLSYVQSIILKIMFSADELGMDEQMIFEKEESFLEELNHQNHLEDVKELLYQFCMEIANEIGQSRDSLGKQQAIKALEYIDKNYQDSGISLNSACRYMAMSTSYFSAMFKNYTGITFIEALTKKRIEKAKELFQTTQMRSYEIAEEVGYSDPHYFSSTFKKYVEESPTEYARRWR